MPASIDLAKQLIAFDTTSRDSNLALIDFVQNMLEEVGACCRRTYDATGKKANLFASFGPETKGGYVLSGHTDVVPVDGQQWSSDPFRAEIRDGKLFGRGACDMKGFIAVALSLLSEIAEAKLKRPIHFALSYDEEVGCKGAAELLADLKQADITPALAVIGEPTLMQIVGAHKGGAVIHTHCHGREGHSSAPHKGASAVMMAGEFIAALEEIGGELSVDRDSRFDPPYTTVQANVVSGGTAVNILARDALVTWEYRALPDREVSAVMAKANDRMSKILPKYRERAEEAAFETELHASYPGLVLDLDSPAIALARSISGSNSVETVAYGTEAGLFQKFGIPAVVCGPGSIDQAHKADEFCALPQFDACEKFLRGVISKACA